VDDFAAIAAPNVSRSKELLNDAVFGRKTKSSIYDRLFAFWFQQLVYPQIWEDPQVDLEALSLKETDHLVAIASGGCNVLSYLTQNPKKITAVDLNHAHVELLHLKIEAIRRLDYPMFYLMFGQGNSDKNVKNYFELLSPHLKKTSRNFWEGRVRGFERIRMFEKGFYKFGLLGQLVGFIHFIAMLYGVKLDELLLQPSVEAQGEWFDKNVAKIFDSYLFQKLVLSPIALYNLGIPPTQYTSLCNGRPDTMSNVLKDRARRLATIESIHNNYFAYQAYGRTYDHTSPTNKPLYLQQRFYTTVRDNIDRIKVEHNNIREVLRQMPAKSVDAYVLLDAQDWMSPEEISLLWAEITRTASYGARVIFRTAGASSPLETLPIEDGHQVWKRNADRSDQLIKEDRSGIYGGFHLYELTQ
jgi:S-adenosylmethionine-diacylglycerol 3-amino-3-carboxypropyl transferase